MSNKNKEICMTEKQFVDICGSTEKKYIPIVLPVIITNPKCSETETEIKTIEPITIENTENTDTITGGSEVETPDTTLETTDTTIETNETPGTNKTSINFKAIFEKFKNFFKNLIVYDQGNKQKYWYWIWVVLSGIGLFWATLCGIFSSITKFLKKQNWRDANVWFTIGISVFSGPLGELIYRIFYIQKYAFENIWQFPDITNFKCPDNCVYVDKEEFDAAGIGAKNSITASFNSQKKMRLVPDISPYIFKPWTYIISLLPFLGPMIVRKYFLTNESIKQKIVLDHTHTAENIEATEKITVNPPEPEINTETPVETETETETTTE